MARIYIKYNPYQLETLLQINGRKIQRDSVLFKEVKGKRLQEWIEEFPRILTEELQTDNFTIEFCGMELDWDDLEEAFENAKKKDIIKELELKFIEGKTDEDMIEEMMGIFTDLKEGPVKDFPDLEVQKAFEDINNAVFPIYVAAAEGSEKSTLIKALLGTRLISFQNKECPITITERADMLLWNRKTTTLMLVDGLDSNNIQNQVYKNAVCYDIDSDSHPFILYLLNEHQFHTNEDDTFLCRAADQIKKGGRQVRERFLFIIDNFFLEEKEIGRVMQSAKQYLSAYGIEEPQIFLCSTDTALNIRTYLEEAEIDNFTKNEEIELRNTQRMIDKLIKDKSLHLERYSALSLSIQKSLEYRLKRAKESGNIKEQALIYCGIDSIETAIMIYRKKYIKPKKIKDLVDFFQEVLKENQILAKRCMEEDKYALKVCTEKVIFIKKEITSGRNTEVFKEEIDSLDLIKRIKEAVKKSRAEAEAKISKLFQPYEDSIRSREEVKQLIHQFAIINLEEVRRIRSDLERMITQEVIEIGERILLTYQKKCLTMDGRVSDIQLNFGTFNLIKGLFDTLCKELETWCLDDFAIEIIEDIGDVDYEEKVYYEKVQAGIQDEIMIRNGYVRKVKHIEKFTVAVVDIQMCINTLIRGLNKNIDSITKYANDLINNVNSQLKQVLNEENKWNEWIQQKCDELEKCEREERAKKVKLKNSSELLEWIEVCREELNKILEI